MSKDLVTSNELNIASFDSESVSKSKESFELKIDWFKHVLKSIEKLNVETGKLNNKIHCNNTAFSSEVFSVKEYIYGELKSLRKEFSSCKDTCHGSFDGIKNKLDTKVEKVSIRIDYEKERIEDRLLLTLNKKLETLNSKVDKLSEGVVALRVKMALIGIMGGVFGSIVLFLAQLVTKKYF